jgi:hypothetical protein
LTFETKEVDAAKNRASSRARVIALFLCAIVNAKHGAGRKTRSMAWSVCSNPHVYRGLAASKNPGLKSAMKRC